MRAILLLSVLAFGLDAPFTVKEDMNQARTGEAVTCGVAFKKGEVRDLGQLALFKDGSAEIPAQFSKLVRFEDGSYQWVLCDFTDDFAANAENQYLVKTQAPSASPANAISVTRVGSVVTVDNGVLSFQIDTLNFKGIQSLVHGSNTLMSGSTGGLFIRDEVGDTSCWNGPVTKAGFVYLGAQRATLRVEGEFYRGSCGGLGYSYMVTTYAGSPRLKIEVQIRNSINPSCGRLAKIRRSYAAFPLSFTPTQTLDFDSTICAGGYYYCGCSTQKSSRLLYAFQDAGKGLLISERWGGGLYPAWLHESKINGNTLETDIIRNHDTLSMGLGSGYQADSATGGDTLFKLLDMDVKNSEIWLECYSGAKSQGELQPLSAKFRGRLIGRLEPGYLSMTGAFSAGRFGTLEDEIASYTKWGWSFTEIQKPTSKPVLCGQGGLCGGMRPQPDAKMEWEDIHGESESDDAAGLLLQWVRTGGRGYFDFGEAWARYYKTHYAFRTTGFSDDGQYAINRPVTAVRTAQSVAGAPDYWTAFGMGRADFSAWGGCHAYGEGLLDYYCLTGDIDALEGGVDLGESIWAMRTARHAGGAYGYADTVDSHASAERGLGRHLLVMSKLYEVLRDSVSLNQAKHCFNILFKSKTKNPRGLFEYATSYYGGQVMSHAPDSLKNYLTANNITLESGFSDGFCAWGARKGAESWPLTTGSGMMPSYAIRAAERMADAVGWEDAIDWIIGYAQYTKLITPRCGEFPYNAELLDFPEKGMVLNDMGMKDWDPAHGICVLPDGSYNHSTVPGSLPAHTNWYTSFFVGIAAIGYRYCGDPDMLQRAYRYWDFASKRGLLVGASVSYLGDDVGADTYWFMPEHSAGAFAYHASPKDDLLCNTNQLFYEAVHHTDTVPPPAVTNLSVGRLAGSAGLVFTWSAPADAASYQLKYFKDLRIVEYKDYDYWRDKDSCAPWWYVRNVSGEPVPASAGTPQSFELAGNFPADSVYYAALCSRDTAGNLSPLSNVVKIDNTIAVEKAGAALLKAAFSICPNPFNPVVTIRLPSVIGPSSIAIYNVAGKKVWQRELLQQERIAWNATDGQGKALPSGAYFVKWKSGEKTMIKKVTLVR